MKQRKVLKLLSLLLVSAIVATTTACGSGKDEAITTTTTVSEQSQTAASVAEAKPDPVGKYAEPITVFSAFDIAGSTVAPEGMSATSNPWLTAWAEKLGIKVQYKFVANDGADYETKMNLAVTSGDLPDIFSVKATLFADLAADGMLEDLTKVYEDYTTEATKAHFVSDGGLMEKNTFVDGKRLGIMQPADYTDSINTVAIRQDWLDKLKLQGPKTVTDIVNIAQAFIDAKLGGNNTIGIGASKDLTYFGNSSIEQLLNAYGGYYDYKDSWILKSDKLENSVIQPEMKVALGKVREIFEKGLIDPEFGAKTIDKVWEDAVGGRTGIVFNDFCAPFRTVNGVKNGQIWSYFSVNDETGKIAKQPRAVAPPSAIVVRKGYEHPEALMKMLNIFNEVFNSDPDKYNNNGIINFASPFQTMIVGKNNVIHKEYKKFIETGVMPANANADMKSSIDSAELYNKDKNIDGYIMWNIFGPEGTQKIVSQALEEKAFMISEFTGVPTTAMSTVEAVLNTIEEQMITSIITGSKPLDYFDEFVKNWKASGGDTYTAEVNEWYSKQAK